MSDRCAPVLRRSHSSAGRFTVDPYNQAEQGLQVNSTNVAAAAEPPEARRTLSMRCSFRSSDSTLIDSGQSFELRDRNIGSSPLPSQGMYQWELERPMVDGIEPPRNSTTWSAGCLKVMQWLPFSQPSQQCSATNPPDQFKLGYSRFQYEKCTLFLQLSARFSWCFTTLIKQHRW